MTSKVFNTPIEISQSNVEPTAKPNSITLYAKPNGRLYTKTPDGLTHNTMEHQRVYFKSTPGAPSTHPEDSHPEEHYFVYHIEGDLVTPYIWEPEP